MPTPPPPWEVLDRMRRRLRLLIWWSGLSHCLLALLGGLLIAGWLDWWLRLDDTGLRVLLAVSVWAIVGWTLWRALWRPLRHELSDVFLAEQIDRRFPGMSSRLTTAAEFRSRQLDPRQGSTELQELVIRQAAADLQIMEPERLLEPRRLSPLIAGALGVCLLTVAVLYAWPLEASTAMRRMTWPWGNTPWPRETVLQLSDADGRPLVWNPRESLERVRGETLELRVENLRGDLPSDLRLQTREPGQELPEETPLRPGLAQQGSAPVVKPPGTSRLPGTSSNREFAVVALPVIEDALEFRVIGGDDQQLPWYSLSAIDPPQLAAAIVTIVPPAYTREASVTLPEGTTQIRGWIGSKVRVQARSDRAVSGIELRVDEQPLKRITADTGNQSWSTELTISRPGITHFSFVLRDERGFAQTQPLQFELRGEVDAIPEVVLREPASDLWVTPEATILFQADARDDLGVTVLQRAWQRGDEPVTIDRLEEPADQPRQVQLQHRWELAALKLQAGERIVVRIEAQDACDTGEPHVGRSAPRTLLIVSPDEKRRELTDRIAELVEELRDSQTGQQGLQTQAQALQTQLRDVGELQTKDRDLLNRLQWDQRRLAERLGDQVRGLGQRARQLQQEFPANQLHDPEAEPQLEQLGQELENLAATTLPTIDRQLTEAIKSTEATRSEANQSPEAAGSPSGKPAALTAIQQTQQLQQDVMNLLKERHADLSRWQQDRNLGDELQSLAETQQQINRDTAEMGARTLSKSLSELTSQQRADLNKLADRQRQASQRIEQLQRDFEEMSERMADRDPGRAAEALELSRELQQSQLSMRLRQAGDDVAANRMGAAGDVQQQAEETMRKLMDDWSSARPDDAEQLLKRTSSAEELARSLAEDVEELRKQTDADTLSQLTPGQREELQERALELRRKVERLERQLQRLRLHRETDQARKIARQLKSVQQAIQAGEDAAAREEFEDAAAEIEELQQELAEARQAAADKLAEEEIERVLGTLQSLKTRQDGLIVELQRLAKEQQTAGRLTRGQLRSLQDQATVEQELQQTTEQTRDKLQEAVVARSALDSVARSMAQVAERLSSRKVDVVTTLLAGDASRRLDRIIAAWNRKDEPDLDQEAGESGQAESSQGEQPEQAGPPGESISWKLQLALLRELQADCLDRTLELEQQRQPDGQLPPELEPLVQDLATEQGALIELVQKLADQYREAQAKAAAAADGASEPASADSSDVSDAPGQKLPE